MPRLLESFARAVCTSRIGPVQRSAQRYGGYCTYAFSQYRPPVSTLTKKDETTSGGVCVALSAHWIYHHAQDSSLWDWLVVDGKIQPSKLIFDIMQLQRESALNNDYTGTTESWFRRNGIERRQTTHIAYRPDHTFTIVAQQRLPTAQLGASGMRNAAELASAILGDVKGGIGHYNEITVRTGHYKMLSILGKAGGHTMALWVGQDVMFFDPVYGEFWFESHADFARWFTTSFWSTSLYSYGLSGAFELIPYAKARRRFRNEI